MPNCKNCNSNFEITNEDLEFYETASPQFNNQTYQIPPPTHCPDCRQQRRLAQCNELNLYKSKCDLCQTFTLTYFPPSAEQPIYCRECWHSDKWDPRDYGQEYNPNKSFFEQWSKVRKNTPAQALSIQGVMENSEYVHQTGDCKNCYITMHADHNEDCYYGYGIKRCKSCVDGFYNIYCELCYECIDCHSCYGLTNCQDCFNCANSAFLRDCVGCKNCFLCTGLRSKQYCFRNKQYSKEEYEEIISKIDLGSYHTYQKCLEEFTKLQKAHTYKEFQGFNLENCFGMHLYNCKDTKYSFDCDDVEHGKFLYQVVIGAKDVYDIYQYGNKLELSYECAVSGLASYNLLFCYETHWSKNVYYSWYIENSTNLFGCSSMHHQHHCILNKQYTKEEYETLVPQIIKDMEQRGEWGEFFPITTSPFGYNQTMSHIFYPISKEEAINKNWKWDDYEPPSIDIKTIPPSQLPDNIKETEDSILEQAILCQETQKPFKLTKPELQFYRTHNLPLPRKNWRSRYDDRLSKRNPRRFWERHCNNCQKEIHTSYSPNRPEKIFCEECYNKSVY